MKTRIGKKLTRTFAEHKYELIYWEDFDYSFLRNIIVRRTKAEHGASYADIIIMADTETSRSSDYIPNAEQNVPEDIHYNHVCAWSLSMRSLGYNLATIWGKRPSDMVKAMARIREEIESDEIYIYFHNLSYDWVFIRKFMLHDFGIPDHQLNRDSLYPLIIGFENGIVLRDSLCLAQRKLEKWGKDMQVEHAKAVGKWDYDLIRNADWIPSDDELQYMECDVLCGVECIDATMKVLKKNINNIPLTATGIPRGEARTEGKKNKCHDWYLKNSPKEYDEQLLQEHLFQGGYTHPNRFIKGELFPNVFGFLIKCRDFSSSYPFVLLARMFPKSAFAKLPRKNVTPEYILKHSEKFAFMFRIRCHGITLKDPHFPMPYIAYSKCDVANNAVLDNGRVIKADYIEMWVTEIDFKLIYETYVFLGNNVTKEKALIIEDVRFAEKDWLPRWFTDYVFSRYKEKTDWKDVDPVIYAIEKGKLNALYGMCAQRPVQQEIEENYETGLYEPKLDIDYEKEYKKHLDSWNSFLPYHIGIYVTAYARENLFTLGKCIPEGDMWVYSDTDSIYATDFDEDMIKAYNDKCISELKERGYDGVEHDGKMYYLGVAEDDGTYMQFKAIHSKCYVKRPLTAIGENFVMGEDLKLTVAGVPKKGVKTLKNNINAFHVGTVFDGETSGKLQHTHWFIPEAYIDKWGNEQGDSIELSPCSYVVTDPNEIDFEALAEHEVMVLEYTEEEYAET